MEGKHKKHIQSISKKKEEDYVQSDGHDYEKTCIDRWLKTHTKKSPMINEKINNNIIPCSFVKKNIKQLYEKYPEFHCFECHNDEQ